MLKGLPVAKAKATPLCSRLSDLLPKQSKKGVLTMKEPGNYHLNQVVNFKLISEFT